MHSLPLFVQLAGRAVILIGSGDAAVAKRRLLERAGARVIDEGGAAVLAIVAQDAPEAVAARLKARGILVNVVDRPDLCDFTLPAIIDRDPVLIAIGTGGASAGLAKALRQRLEAMLPQTLGDLARQLSGARAAIRARWPDAENRRRSIDSALAAGAALDPLAETASGAIERWLAAPVESGHSGLVPLRLSSPDPDDLTLRQARLLASADQLFHRADVPTAILDRARADAVRIACEAPPQAAGPGLTLDISIDAA